MSAEQFVKLQLYSIDVKSFPQAFSIGTKPENLHRNRYQNVIALNNSRVILKSGKYINASHVYLDSNHYILAQAPVDASIADFWAMIWEQQCGLCVMLTALFEKNQVKADRYWPANLDFPLTLSNGIQITKHSEDSPIEKLFITRFALKHKEQEQVDPRSFTLVRDERWQDFSCPPLDIIEPLCERLSDMTRHTGPLLIHCSAGIGRSAVLCALMAFYKNPHLDFLSTMRVLREQRAGAIVNYQQFSFVREMQDFFSVLNKQT